MDDPGPSAPIARSTLVPQASGDQLGVARVPSERPTLSLPHATYNASNISGGTINNVYGDLNNIIHHQVVHNHHYGLSSFTSFDRIGQSPPSIPPLNDAPIDRISLCFTGREWQLNFITTSFNTFRSDKPTRFVIYGMPGLGKSQLALQHANLEFTAGTYSLIFWVSASTVEKLGQGLARILGLVNHADRNHPDQDVQLAAVRLWLEQSEHHGCHRWLLIIDNVTVESAQFLREHLPRQNTGGNILLTTRTRNIAESVANVAGQEHITFELKALSKVQSVNLLLNKAGLQISAPTDLDSAERLVSRIGCLPLAIEQAGAYMKRSGLKSSSQLQNMYEARGLNEVIRWENDLITYDATSILSTFTAQLQRLDAIDPDALKLLKTLAFLDPENIPLDILSLGARSIRDRLAENEEVLLAASPASEPAPKVPIVRRLLKKLKDTQRGPFDPNARAAADAVDPLEGVPADLRGIVELICSEERVRTALRHFEDLSIAQPLHNDQPSLHVHDLIQWVLQQSTVIHQEAGYRALAIALLCHAFGTIDDPDETQSWAACERFVPHFAALGTQDKMYPTISETYMDANHAIAQYVTNRGRYSEAETLLVRALASRKRLLGLYNSRTFGIMHSLARVYYNQGRYQEAESLFVPVLAAHRRYRGVDRPTTLTTENELALLYASQGRLDEAEKLYVRALAGLEKQLGADHQSTLVTMGNLASLHVSRGKFSKAEKLYTRSLAGREKRFGADHPSTLTTLHNLAGLYVSQKKFTEAESLYARVLAGDEKQLGADHPDTLTTVHDIAYLRYQQGQYDEAETRYGRALIGQEAKLGLNHPHTQVTRYHLAELLEAQGRWEEGEALFERMNQGTL